MSAQCDIAAKIMAKKRLQEQLTALRNDIRSSCKEVELPFTVEYEGHAVTVKPGSAGYYGPTDPMPIVNVSKIAEYCEIGS